MALNPAHTYRRILTAVTSQTCDALVSGFPWCGSQSRDPGFILLQKSVEQMISTRQPRTPEQQDSNPMMLKLTPSGPAHPYEHVT